jgi:hypothetical protein
LSIWWLRPRTAADASIALMNGLLLVLCAEGGILA